ncbi:hypothetical protein AX16_003232 [Volvariella volvacea WC 439]|nr:hypothetical protein AX16_003232 [Volvariella volvacea WC 439]
MDIENSSNPSEGSIIVDSVGTELFYTDSGAPPGSSTYTTAFTVHGLSFTGEIFRRIMDLAPAANLRIVSINRRNYPGSTPFNDAERDLLMNGSDAQKTEFLDAQGMQLLTFIDKYMIDNRPPLNTHAKTGGIALMGWSLGNVLTLAAVANADKLPTDARDRLASQLRSVIMLEPPSNILGLPIPPQAWSPLIDTSIPPETQLPFFSHWITAYFKHGDISKRDNSLLSFVVPDPLKVPSIYTMTEDEIPKLIYEDALALGDGLLALVRNQIYLANYQKVVFDQSFRALFRNMQVWMVTGDATASFSISALWSVQDDELARGALGSFVNYKTLKGANHFVHWDEPANTIEYIQSML